jgi:hypothetical protein
MPYGLHAQGANMKNHETLEAQPQSKSTYLLDNAAPQSPEIGLGNYG